MLDIPQALADVQSHLEHAVRMVAQLRADSAPACDTKAPAVKGGRAQYPSDISLRLAVLHDYIRVTGKRLDEIDGQLRRHDEKDDLESFLNSWGL
jgi:hypothetical protein